MKILYVHNRYGKPSGEETAAEGLVELLREHGHEVRWFMRSSEEIINSFLGKIKALFAGIYNPFSAKRISKIIKEFKPDIIHVQNIYPLISSTIFPEIRKYGIPVVMRCPNYRLFCPQGLCIDPSGNICERCWGGHEWNCVKKNCMGSKSKSIGYALRNIFSRKTKNIIEGVDMFIVQSEFQKNKFISQGISPDSIGILPGLSPKLSLDYPQRIGKWVSFVGRVSSEKGIYEFIEAAKLNPKIPFKVAGNLDENFVVPKDIPNNLEFVGFKKGEELDEFYNESKIIVVPSKWYEGFPNVIVRAMQYKKPVVTSNIGAMASIIDTDVNGILISPGDARNLSNVISELYRNDTKCTTLGKAGFEKAEKLYSRAMIYDSLIDIYSKAINRHNKTT